MKVSARSLGLIALLGGVGGAINVGLLYVMSIQVVSGIMTPEFPLAVGVRGLSSSMIFSEIAGMLHGAILACVSVWLSALFLEQPTPIRWIGLLFVGWCSGLLASIPIFAVWMGSWIDFSSLRTNMLSDWKLFIILPWVFGLVGLSYYVLLNLCGLLPSKSIWLHLLLGSLSGSLGSLFFWLKMAEGDLGHLSFIHGTIWGSLVGFGVWKSQRAQTA